MGFANEWARSCLQQIKAYLNNVIACGHRITVRTAADDRNNGLGIRNPFRGQRLTGGSEDLSPVLKLSGNGVLRS
ncbi:hypothetical protein M378DRAFT_168940 [Amanita muscaria Koide BX008]|uniref:Uncharacterized protein n=1 Tax=Amanita muscaria (strain Koide BX008) TaxID=946122 RepID=A0A0C2WSF5_AMAMK|nr:hypothetical protein M378DRAFT_168940 [Amanita muscaria Koide BX008]